jgi:hypothetical protein
VDLTATAVTGSTEEYDGSTWTASPPGLNTARLGMGSAGTQTATLAFGGDTGSVTGATEEYDGSTWTSNPTGLNTVRFGLGGAGIQTAALGFGGQTPTNTGATEEYDGSTWATSPSGSLNTARDSFSRLWNTIQQL